MSVTARVLLTIEINTGESWSEDTTIVQIKKQAIDSARNKITKLLSHVGGIVVRDTTSVKVVDIEI